MTTEDDAVIERYLDTIEMDTDTAIALLTPGRPKLCTCSGVPGELRELDNPPCQCELALMKAREVAIADPAVKWRLVCANCGVPLDFASVAVGHVCATGILPED